MKIIRLPVLTQEIALSLPDEWQVEIREVREARALGQPELAAALDCPLGTPGLEKLARGKKRAMILVDDCMRPTPAAEIAPLVVERLLGAGLAEGQIRFMLATGMHRAQTGRDLVAKLGRDMVSRFEILPHNPYENLAYLGQSPRGIPIWVNRWVAESDLRVGIGCIIPHSGAGFGGGAKIVMPGVCGIETVAAHHEGVPRGVGVEGNVWREEIEAIARQIGLDLVVNAVLNGQGQVAGLFVGDMVAAHRQAVALALQLYSVELPRDVDVAISSGYPMDQEIAQARKAVHLAARCVRPGGSVALLGECPEGAGFHALYGAGGRFQEKARGGIARALGDRQVWVCSPGVSISEARQYLPDSSIVIREPEELVARLAERHPRARACVLKQGMMLVA